MSSFTIAAVQACPVFLAPEAVALVVATEPLPGPYLVFRPHETMNDRAGALEQGVEGVVILDGKVPHAVLLELFTELGAGTLIHR